MLIIELQGGLGNQLFQIFAGMNKAIECNSRYIFPYNKQDTHSAGGSRRPTYWDTIFSELSTYTKMNKSVPIYRERSFNYTPLPSITNNQILTVIGYFQSPKYFMANYDTILTKLNIRAKQAAIRAKYMLGPAHISLHFRIGDYATPQHTDAHPIQSVDYYIKALHAASLAAAQEQTRVMYFYEDVDTEIVHTNILALEREFPSIKFTPRPSAMDDWEELLLMSCCDSHIIANSSFSWWGAYLNPNQHKKVYYPSVWFGKALANHNTQDLFPDDWHRITI